MATATQEPEGRKRPFLTPDIVDPTKSKWMLGLLVGITAVLGGVILGFGGPLAGAAFVIAIIVAYVV